MEQINNKQST